MDPTITPSHLLDRLDAIGRAIAARPHALALIGLGSVGTELDRLDRFSDLDFFVVVEAGHKAAFIADLAWMAEAGPIGYAFRNTPNGCKLLYADGIFCEFAVFEPDELERIPFSPGRVVWKRDTVPAEIGVPKVRSAAGSPRPLEWQLGEALTNLYVGLGRAARGEKLSAARFIQGYAIDRLIDLVDLLEPAVPTHRDTFSAERRFEQRHPAYADRLAAWMQGYGRNRESALEILGFLEANFEVNPQIAAAIRNLCVQ